MDSTTRFIVGLLVLLAVQILFGGTVVYLIRRWEADRTGLDLAHVHGSFLPSGSGGDCRRTNTVIGRVAAVIMSLVGLKRISGLDVLSTFMLSFCMGISVFIVAAVISNQLQVDLLGLQH